MAVVMAPAAGPQSDEQLLARLAAGDREVLGELFRRYRGVAYRVAYRLLGNEADALDAVQDGFVKVLTHVGGFQGRSTFKTWLLRVVSNAALDLGRARGRREASKLEAADEPEPPARLEDPALPLERADLRRLIDEALASLPEAQRRTFVLHAEAELSYREVADILEISIGTVMSRLFYARQRLRAYLRTRIESDASAIE
ncbi:MAG: RNA polymerase sigma factor [Gemmataceae bacterium]|nr:RNA polymerase sigma factor [Gemmataceae bacterium]MDW8264716.1 RNA polymerase sigma factor [Gemmataceae bacterium]